MAGIGALLVGAGVGLYCLFMFAFLTTPIGVETRTTVVERFQEQDVSEWGRPRETYHAVSVAEFVDASGAVHRFEEQGALPNTFTVRYLSFKPDTVMIVTENMESLSIGYGFGALVALGIAGQGGVWVFGKRRAVGNKRPLQPIRYH
ncbi:MAG TPA: hypothetical protein VI547_12450 [Anaerolineales bacterium]|nr:hypothetical protein [Anaerolineales bacterium]